MHSVRADDYLRCEQAMHASTEICTVNKHMYNLSVVPTHFHTANEEINGPFNLARSCHGSGPVCNWWA